MISCLLQQLLESYVHDKDAPLEKRMEVFKFYGTFARTMLTMFEITLGNWMPPCRALVENVSEGWLLFFILHRLFIGFSVLAVVNAVFIQETFKVATQDDRILLMQKNRAVRIHAKKMNELFQTADADGNGALSLDEFNEVIHNE